MDKSRNNEVIFRDSKNGLKAIEKNDNILEKTKNQYIKRSIYSTKYSEYQIDKSFTKKNFTDRKYASSLNFTNFCLIKSQSTGKFPEQRNVLPVLKISNTKKQPFRSTQYTRPAFHDLFVASKLNDNSLSKAKNTAFKFSIDIENLLTKRQKMKRLTKIKTPIDKSKEGSAQDQQLSYYDEELPAKYKTILSTIISNMNFKRKNQVIDISLTVRQAIFEELKCTISRKISIYNQNNKFIKEADVVGFIHHEVGDYFIKKKIQLKKRRKSEGFIDLELDQKCQIHHRNSLVSDYNEINHHKQFIMNKLIKKKLNRSDDLYYNNKMIQNAEKVAPKMKNKGQISQIHLMLNNAYDDSAFNDYLFLTTSPQYSTGNNNVLNQKEFVEKEIQLKRHNPNPNTDELEMTMRSFNILQPKGLNDDNLNEKRDKKKIIKPNNSHKNPFELDHAKKESINSKRVNEYINNSKNKSKVNNFDSNKQSNSSRKNSTLVKTQNENCSNYHENIKSSFEMKKQLDLEETENQRLKIEKENQEKIEAERLEKERLSLQEKRIMKQEEEYQRFVETKKQEELKKLEEIQNKNDEKEIKTERKFRNFYVVNKENQKSLLSVLQPSKVIIKEQPSKRIRSILIPITEQKQSTPKNEGITPKNQKSAILSSEQFKIKKLPIENEHESTELKHKREVYLIKVKQDIKYYFENNKKQDETDKQQIEEFNEKINQSLINISNEINTKDLTTKLDNMQEQIDDHKEGQEDEKRINTFIRTLDNSLNLMKEKNKHFYNKFKIVNNQFSYHCLTPIKSQKEQH